jgi:hypothetical protein
MSIPENLVKNANRRSGQYWYSDNGVSLSRSTYADGDRLADGGFSWPLTSTPFPSPKNAYTGMIPRVPGQGMSFALTANLSNVTGGSFALHIFGYTADGSGLGSLVSPVVMTASGRWSISIADAAFPAGTATVRFLILGTGASSSSNLPFMFRDVVGNYGTTPLAVTETNGFFLDDTVYPDETIAKPAFAHIYPKAWVSPQDFGAVGDGLTDDTAAFQAMVGDGRKCIVGKPRNGYGYKIGSIVLNQPVEIEFEGVNNFDSSRAKLFHFGSDPLFRIKSSHVCIRGGFLDGTLASTGAPAFAVDLAAGSLHNINISDVVGVNMGGIFHVLPSSTNQLSFVRLEKFVFSGQRGKGLYLPSVFSAFFADNLYLEWLLPANAGASQIADANYPMCEIPGNTATGAGGIFLRQVFLQGANVSGATNNSGIVFTGPGSGLRMQQVDVDGAGGDGLVAYNVDEIRADDLGLDDCWGYGMNLNTVHHLFVTGLRSDGRRGNSAGSNPGKHAIYVQGGLAWTKIFGDASNHTGRALEFDGTNNYASEIRLCAADCGSSGTDYCNVGNVDPDSHLNRIAIDGVN